MAAFFVCLEKREENMYERGRKSSIWMEGWDTFFLHFMVVHEACKVNTSQTFAYVDSVDAIAALQSKSMKRVLSLPESCM